MAEVTNPLEHMAALAADAERLPAEKPLNFRQPTGKNPYPRGGLARIQSGVGPIHALNQVRCPAQDCLE